MSRHIYCNLIKIIINSILLSVFIPSSIIYICYLFVDKQMNIASLLITISCFFTWVISKILIRILNRYSKNKIVIYEDKVNYKGKIYYKDILSIKYFKFHISFLEPDLVISKLHFNSNGICFTCYLSRLDVCKIKKLGYFIREV